MLLSSLFARQTSGAGADVQHYAFYITLNDSTNRIEGRAEVTVRYIKDDAALRLDLAGPRANDSGMRVSAVRENGNDLVFTQDADGITFSTGAKKGTEHTYTIIYAGIPADGLIISSNKFGHRTYFGDNWPNRAHQWLPCVDHPDDKATVEFLVTAPAHYKVVSNGIETENKELPNNTRLTHWVEKVALPTKVMVIGVADFAVQKVADVQGIPVFTYVFPENSEQGFRSYAAAAKILPYYIKMIGPYAYEKLANIQSKTIFGGMENASAIFYFENSVESPGIEPLMAHEIAHQWFGDAVTETSFAHLWLSEGFATYMTNLYMEHTYGEDTLKSRLTADRKRVIEFAAGHAIPVVDTNSTSGNYMFLLNANSYQKGGWILHMLRRSLGDSIFWNGIRLFFARYDGINASTRSFREAMEQVSGKDLSVYFKQWLYTPGVPALHASIEKTGTGGLTLRIEQTQPTLFSFPLEYATGKENVLKRVEVTQRVTSIPLPPLTTLKDVRIDPNVNLLADIRMAD